MTTTRTPMTPADLTAWLFDTPATEVQRAELLAADAELCRIIPDDGEPDTGTVEFTGAAKLILGDESVATLGAAWQAARAAEREAMAELRGALVAAHLRGAHKTDLATQAGVNRRTVDRALGR